MADRVCERVCVCVERVSVCRVRRPCVWVERWVRIWVRCLVERERSVRRWLVRRWWVVVREERRVDRVVRRWDRCRWRV